MGLGLSLNIEQIEKEYEEFERGKVNADGNVSNEDSKIGQEQPPEWSVMWMINSFIINFSNLLISVTL